MMVMIMAEMALVLKDTWDLVARLIDNHTYTCL